VKAGVDFIHPFRPEFTDKTKRARTSCKFCFLMAF
jgi:hypothetical protein